jgi:hypothetical protein
MVRGSVDIVTTSEIQGWAYGMGRPAPVRVQAVLNHEIIGEAHASIHRADLAAAGLGDGNSGFLIKLYRTIDQLYLPFIVVKVEGGDVELPRAPMLGFSEFFAALYAVNPGAGRHRSVYGGLWTDRTDASALLRGKLAVGQLSVDASQPIQEIIHNGFAVVPLAEVPEIILWQRAAQEAATKALRDPALSNVLCAVLEDHPLPVKSEWMTQTTALAQPSARNPSPSPAECVEIVIPFGDGVVLDVVRDSHKLPEFTSRGASRWRGAAAIGAASFLDHYDLPPGSVAIIGPGTIYSTRQSEGTGSALISCVPMRGRLAEMAEIGDGLMAV